MLLERLLFFGVVLLFLLLPGHPLALLGGLPLNPFGLAVGVVLVGWAIALPCALPRTRPLVGVLIGMAVLKAGLAWMAPPYGLLAEYRVGGSEATAERSTDWRGPGTRVDLTLAFRGTEFPVHFFNDVDRFNFFTAADPSRDLLPFAARWSGQLWVPSDGRYQIALEANGTASLALAGLTADGAPLAVASGQRVQDVSATAELSSGLHAIEVRYARPDEGMPWLRALVARDGGELRPIAAPSVVRPGAVAATLLGDATVRWAAIALDVAFLGVLAACLALHARAYGRAPRLAARLERPLLGLFAAVALGLELVGHLHLAGQATLLSGGNDWLAYEGFARDVLLNGPLLTGGRGPGEGQPYYYQPLYVYWLALVHLVLGESLFGPLFGNAALGVVANLLVYALTRQLFGRAAAAAALIVFAMYRATVFAPTAGLLLSENVLFPILPLLLLLLVDAARTGSWRYVAGAGFVLGLAALTRTTPLTLLPPAMLILAVAFRRLGLSRNQAVLRLGGLVAVCFLTIAPATARNYVVSGRSVFITSSAGANLWEAHRPTPRVDLSRVDRDPLYERLGLDRKSREVVEFVRQDPAGYAATLLPMALYAVGVVGAVAGTGEVHVGLLGLWLLYLVLTVAVPAARRPPTWPVHAFIWSHLALMTVFMSHQYGFRLILPMYVAMVPIVAGGCWALADGCWSRPVRIGQCAGGSRRGSVRPARIPRPAAYGLLRPAAYGLLRPAAYGLLRPAAYGLLRPAAYGLLPAAVLLGSVGIAAESRAPERAREAFYGLTGDAGIALRYAARPESLRLADATYFVGDDSRSSDVAYLRGLAYPTVRWFDGARGLVLPPRGQHGLYVLPDRAAADVARRCLGDQTVVSREQDRPTRAWLDIAVAGADDSGCALSRQAVGARFEGTGRVLGFDAPATAEPGQQIEVALRWEVLARPTARSRPFVRLVDRRGIRWGQAEATVYPSSAWQAGEVAYGTARLEIDPTLPPSEYRLELGFTLGSGWAALAEDGPWGAQGAPTADGGGLRLVSRSAPLSVDTLPIDLPLQAELDGVRLLGAQIERTSPRQGDRVRLSLFWQNAAGRLADRDVVLVLRDGSGAVVQEARGGPVDGSYAMSSWKPGEIVRDPRELVVPAGVAGGPLALEVGLAAVGGVPDRYERVATLAVQSIERRFADPQPRTRQDAHLGDLARLVGFDLRNRRLKAGDNLDVTLVWQALAEMSDGHTVSLQLRGDDGLVVARQDGEPAADRRPTTGWLPGEYVEDAHRLRVSRDTPRGRYRLAVAVYRTEDRRPLLAVGGADHVLLAAEVIVE